MRKNVFGRQLKRDTNERKALIKNLLTSLVLHDRITTSTAKAKAIKGAADKLVTKAKLGGREAYRSLEARVNHDAVIKLIDEIAPRFANRAGGYTRIIKVGNRVADNAAMSIIEWVEKPVAGVVKPAVKKKKAVKKEAVKKTEKSTIKKVETKKVAVKKADVKQVRSSVGRKTGI